MGKISLLLTNTGDSPPLQAREKGKVVFTFDREKKINGERKKLPI